MENSKAYSIIAYAFGVVGVLFGVFYPLLSSKKDEGNNTVEKYKVSYVYNDSVLYEEEVTKGNNVTNVPTLPELDGYTLSWSGEGTNVQADQTICAVKNPKKYTINFATNFNYSSYNLNGKLELRNENTRFVYDFTNTYSIDVYVSFKIENKTFTVNDNNYHIDEANSKITDDNSNEVGTFDSETGCISFTNELAYQSFTLSSDLSYVERCTNVYFQTEKYFSVDDNNYIYDTVNNLVLNAEDNSVAAKQYSYYFMYFKEGSLEYICESKKAKYFKDDGVTEYSVVNNKFTVDSIEYTLNLPYGKLYRLWDEVGYIDETKKFQSIEYYYGETVSFAYSSENLYGVQLSGDSISLTAVRDMGIYIPNESIQILSDKYVKSIKTDKGYTFFNPIGDITIIPSFSFAN